MFKDLNEVPPLDDWLQYEYIDSDVNKKLYKTKKRLTGNEIEKETKHYAESLNHDTTWLKTINIKIDKLLINLEYINFLIIMFMKRSKGDSST